MRKSLILFAVLALIGGGVALAASGDSNDLPRDAQRDDCPGMIECPLTGELICADQCPLRKGEAVEDEVPPCCRDKE